jgi:plastocyanin
MIRQSRRLLAGFLVLAALSACSSSSNTNSSGTNSTPSSSAPAAQGTVAATVVVKDFKFAPDPVTVKVGDAVKWDFEDSTPHTSTALDSTWDSGSKSKGETFTFTFTKAGTFKYKCSIHPVMTGTVTVS